jgi:predicted HicB family RNase H-like nuclease
MLENDYYTYRVTWSIEDNEYVGLCSEFPSLSWLASDQDSALSGIRQLVAEAVDDMLSNHEEIPEPIATKKFSGHFLVRIPPELHRELVLQAIESGISLNRLASDRLSRSH